MSDGVDRRDFLKILGLGAAAVASGCGTRQPERIIPYLVPPEDIIPGTPVYYTSACTECPAGCGLLVRTREGRAVKLEGNPDHPVNKGRLCARGHSMLQGLYNPDRLAAPTMRAGTARRAMTWQEASSLVVSKLRAARGRPGAVAILTGHQTGTLAQLFAELSAALGPARHVTYEAFGHEAERAAAKQVFGVDGLPHYDIGAANVLVSFGADFLETWGSPTEFARQFADQHSVRGKLGTFVSVAPRLSLTGSNADEWVAVKPGTEGTLALAMANVIAGDGRGRGGAGGAAPVTPQSAAEITGVSADRIVRLTRLFAAGNPSLALAGGAATATAQGTATAAAVHYLNAVAGNVGRTVFPGGMLAGLGTYRDMLDLARAMAAGEVEALVVYDTNPVHTMPDASGFRAALEKVPFSVVFTPYPTETAEAATLALPIQTPLETWGDSEPRPGIRNLLQPVMLPVPTMPEGTTHAVPRFDAQPVGDALLGIARAVDPSMTTRFPDTTFLDYLKRHWQPLHAAHGGGKSFDDFFASALEAGGVFTETAAPAGGGGRGAGGAAPVVNVPAFENAGAPYTLLPYPHPFLSDGRGANRPWLQEQPDPVTKAVWGTWAEIHPRTAEKLGVAVGDSLTVETAHGRITVPAYVYEGVREDVVAVPVGQGHTAFGRYAQNRGANVAAILPSVMDAQAGGFAWVGTRAALSRAGGAGDLFLMYGNDRQAETPIAQVVPLATLLAEGRAASIPASAPTPGSTYAHQEDELGTPKTPLPPAMNRVPPTALEAPGAPRHHRWGMAIDLSSCTGCGACSVACYAENNIAIVGPDRVPRHRDMAWLRIERYWEGHGEALETRFVPMLCQHCTDAPCEPVCPVFATYHNPEGLNVQIYNRCVGTRYCSNNCPYRVREFNWFDYDWPEPLNLQLNPDVTVRSKGIMEKCTFCTQRIREAKDHAQDEERPLADGEVVPACAQTCPTDAIVFGDLNDSTSRVAQLARQRRGYRVLEDLNTKPAITYLKKPVRARAGGAA